MEWESLSDQYCAKFSMRVAAQATNVRVGSQDFPLTQQSISGKVSNEQARAFAKACFDQGYAKVAVTLAHPI